MFIDIVRFAHDDYYYSFIQNTLHNYSVAVDVAAAYKTIHNNIYEFNGFYSVFVLLDFRFYDWIHTLWSVWCFEAAYEQCVLLQWKWLFAWNNFRLMAQIKLFFSKWKFYFAYFFRVYVCVCVCFLFLLLNSQNQVMALCSCSIIIIKYAMNFPNQKIEWLRWNYSGIFI